VGQRRGDVGENVLGEPLARQRPNTHRRAQPLSPGSRDLGVRNLFARPLAAEPNEMRFFCRAARRVDTDEPRV
jgi:hypothetical protein